MTSDRFDRFIDPARARPALWRLVAGVALGGALYVICIAATFFLASLAVGPDALRVALQSGAHTAAPVPTLVLLLSFAGMALGVIVAARALHRRGLRSLIGPVSPALRDFSLAAAVALAVYLPGVLLWSLFYDAQPNLPPWRWLALLPLTLLALLIQTGAEELVFRGYLMQQLAARFRSWLIWFWGPALVFGAIHYAPATSGDNALLLIASPALFGLLAADLTVRTGTLGAAWGFHFANNLIAVALVSTQGTITGLALWLTPYSAADATHIRLLLLADLALLLLAWALLVRLLARRS